MGNFQIDKIGYYIFRPSMKNRVSMSYTLAANKNDRQAIIWKALVAGCDVLNHSIIIKQLTF